MAAAIGTAVGTAAASAAATAIVTKIADGGNMSFSLSNLFGGATASAPAPASTSIVAGNVSITPTQFVAGIKLLEQEGWLKIPASADTVMKAVAIGEAVGLVIPQAAVAYMLSQTTTA
jgi:hypothetical protein